MGTRIIDASSSHLMGDLHVPIQPNRAGNFYPALFTKTLGIGKSNHQNLSAGSISIVICTRALGHGNRDESYALRSNNVGPNSTCSCDRMASGYSLTAFPKRRQNSMHPHTVKEALMPTPAADERNFPPRMWRQESSMPLVRINGKWSKRNRWKL